MTFSELMNITSSSQPVTIAFNGGLERISGEAQSLMNFLIDSITDACVDEIAVVDNRLKVWIKGEIPYE